MITRTLQLLGLCALVQMATSCVAHHHGHRTHPRTRTVHVHRSGCGHVYRHGKWITITVQTRGSRTVNRIPPRTTRPPVVTDPYIHRTPHPTQPRIPGSPTVIVVQQPAPPTVPIIVTPPPVEAPRQHSHGHAYGHSKSEHTPPPQATQPPAAPVTEPAPVIVNVPAPEPEPVTPPGKGKKKGHGKHGWIKPGKGNDGKKYQK